MRFNKLKVGTAVLVCAAAFLGSGLAFAAPQAGDLVHFWYKNGLKDSAVRVRTNADQKDRALLKAAGGQVLHTQQSGVSAVEGFRRDRLKLFNSQLDERMNSYISQIAEETNELIGGNGQPGSIAGQFDDFTNQSLQLADEELEQEAGKLLDSMTQEAADSTN